MFPLFYGTSGKELRSPKYKARILFMAVICVSVCYYSPCHAQLYGQALIDSQIKQIPRHKEDTNKVNLLLDLCFNYASINQEKGVKFGDQALTLAKKLNWKKGIADANKIIGVNYMNKFEYAIALEYYNAAIKIFEEIKDKRGIATVNQNIGVLYASQSDYANALLYYQKAQDIYKEIGDKNLPNIQMNIGRIYMGQSDFAKAHEYLNKALDKFSENGNKVGIVAVQFLIATVYYGQGDFPKALEYDLQSAKSAEEIKDDIAKANAIQHAGSVCYSQKDYPRALEFYGKALSIYENMKNKPGIGMVISNIGNVFYSQENYTEALEYFFKALKIDEEVGDRSAIAINILHIAAAYGYQKNYTMALSFGLKAIRMFDEIGEKATAAYAIRDMGIVYLSMAQDSTLGKGKVSLHREAPSGDYVPDGMIPRDKAGCLHLSLMYLLRSLDTAKKIGAQPLMENCYEYLAKAYKLKGDYKNAMENHELFIAIKDSIFSKENNKKIVQQQMQYDYDLKEKTARAEQDKKDAIQKNIRYSTFAGMSALLIFSVVVYRQRNRVKKEKARSEELLLNILPMEVAEELKATGSSKAKHFDKVTVLFTDFVNFTIASEKMRPQALIDELHICFKTFDEIMARYNIEKIKTIGDAYLAVAGLPEPQENHAENVIRAAIEITDFMESRYARLGDQTFRVRIGVHSGSVVAGIVGVKKFAYDIWGDTVNTAARMEQTSEPGKINVSAVTYDLVKDKFTFIFRGEIEAKNKGMMKMYYVG